MSAILETAETKPAMRSWLPAMTGLALAVAGLVALYWDTLRSMVSIWNHSETFAHAFLVLPISLWLVWRMRADLAGHVPKTAAWVLLPMCPLALLWWLGDLVNVNAVEQFAVVALLVLTVPLMLGLQVTRAILFPLFFLFFMVPVGDFMLPWLMSWTADFTISALQFSGIPVYREGLQFVIPSGTWSVVEACSGVRYMIASFMVGSLFAYLNYNSNRKRLAFCAFSLIVPLVANWLRAYFIVMLGHLSGNKLAVGVDHLIYGWVFFGIVITLMFLVGARWSDPAAEPQQAASGTQPVSAQRPLAQFSLAAISVLLVSVPHLLNWRTDGGSPAASSNSTLMLPELRGFVKSEPSIKLEPRFQNPTAISVQSYRANDATVTVHLAYYRQQRPGSKLVTSTNQLVDSEDNRWLKVGSRTRDVPQPTGMQRWRTTELMGGAVSTSGQRPRVEVRQIYWVSDHLTPSDVQATLYGLKALLLGRGDDAAMITIYSEGSNSQETEARLDAFITQHFDALQAQLAAYRASF